MPSRNTESHPPPGVKLRHILNKQDKPIRYLSWSQDGAKLASSTTETISVWDATAGKELRRSQKSSYLKCVGWSLDWSKFATDSYIGDIQIWEGETKKLLQTLARHSMGVTALAFSPDGESFASGSGDGSIRIWGTKKTLDPSAWSLRHNFYSNSAVYSLAWAPGGVRLAVGYTDGTVRVWETNTGELILSMREHSDWITSLAWSPDGKTLVSGSKDEQVRYYRGEQRGILEAHTGAISSVSFSFDGNFLATKSLDESIRIWRCKNWETVAVIHERSNDNSPSPLAFNSKRSVLATVEEGNTIRIWDLDFRLLLSAPPVAPTVFYTNAKVVLLGDSGVGKSGLGLVLTNQKFVPTDSTHGRHIWTFDTKEIKLKGDRYETRETLLWDLAGQPSYRLIHQLHLNEVAVALVVFDAHSDIDPFAGVRYWMRALRQAEDILGYSSHRIKKILVQARIDRGGVNVSLPRLKKYASDLGFDAFYSTSAKEGTGVERLATAIRKAIDWDSLPRVSSTELFQKIIGFLIEEKSVGRILSTTEDLYRTFLRFKEAPEEDETLPAQFKTCIKLMGARGLIRQLSFGNLVLLQPELLDAYASAMVNAAKDEPDGLGSIPEADAREGRFAVPTSERINDSEQEKLLLIATVEDLLSHEIALREHTDDGTHLVFPTQLTRRNPNLPDPEGKAVIFSFAGPVRNIYATLAVRLSHSGLFKKKEMWKNAAAYEASVGGTCGMFIREFDEGYGELTLFFDDKASEQTRFQFEEYVSAHLSRKASYDSLQRHRIFVCSVCGFVVPRQLIRIRAEVDLDWINCPGCPTSTVISLVDTQKRPKATILKFVPEMDRAADAQREFDTGLTSAVGQMRSRGFREWAGSSQATVALVFTDVVGSTAIANELGNEAMNSVRRDHFEVARHIKDKFGGYEIKTIGDSFMVAFRTAVQALDFALALYTNTGNRRVSIRAGIHVGPLYIEEEDGFGLMVNYTARIVNLPPGAEIWVSNMAKSHIDEEKARRHINLEWVTHDNIELKGFEEKHVLWSLVRDSIYRSEEDID